MTPPTVAPEQSAASRWRFAVDRGGTFTDIIGIAPDGAIHTQKLLSRSPAYTDAAIEGIRRLLNIATGAPLPAERIAWIRLGTTVATNALLERQGTPTGLLITQGFSDLLAIGTQQRPELFALAIRKPEMLYCAVAEAAERIGPGGEVEQAAEPDQLRQAMQTLREAGAEALAIVFLHAWINPAHEQLAAGIARELGFTHVSTSHATLPLIQAVGRGRTTLVDAYLTPILQRYAEQVRQVTGEIPLHFMSSAGGLTPPTRFTGKDAILSGPAGGVLGAASVAASGGDAAAIGFDMGGTSTDVCRYAGTLERVLEAETAGIAFQAPMLQIETVAAGGGSILGFTDGRLTVGPASAGADPGPACYGLGGPATLTDANAVLGRLQPAFFPHVFGTGRNAPLDVAASRQALAPLAAQAGQSLEAAALGYIRIANEAMGRPIKALSVTQGFDLRQHALVSFGGAGAQHACGIAAALGIAAVRIHPLAGLLSAYGIANARHQRQQVATVLQPAEAGPLRALAERARQLSEQLQTDLANDLGSPATGLTSTWTLGVRTPGTDTALRIAFDADPAGLAQAFAAAHRHRFGFQPPTPTPEIAHLEIEVSEPAPALPRAQAVAQQAPPAPVAHVDVWFDTQAATPAPVYRQDALLPGTRLTGPALIVAAHSTIVVEPDFTAAVDSQAILSLHHRQASPETVSTARDPISLELFNHRFMGIAGRMGETLARTAHSVNIKERHDFSCAIFDAHGRLIANAPHVPVHLGAMGDTVAALIERRGQTLQAGDVYVSNDPQCGGSHLPDVTVITPVFRRGTPAFYVANRGHHADIGGTVPGSMPPAATRLAEEGVCLTHVQAVRGGQFLQDAIVAALSAGPYPARNLPERLSDLHAQIAANQRGLTELEQLCERYGDGVVHAYMDHMRANAAEAMRAALDAFLGEREHWHNAFADYLDGGQRIHVTIDISRDHDGKPAARIDFSGTSAATSGNLNTPRAVVRAAVLYVLRTLIARDIPLNAGCLAPISLHIPANSLLDPPPAAAVAGGNVETSQRLVDVLYGALGLAAASQGSMNNLLFGSVDQNDGEQPAAAGQYYETIGGGSGAIRGAAGASGVQVHMTNTRITDPEVLEQRFPWVRVTRFTLRPDSGGAGTWHGGHGISRGLRFLTPTQLTLVTERRRYPPFGLEGGEPGAPGINRLIRADGSDCELPGHFQGRIEAGQTVEIHTPGGGGFGAADDNDNDYRYTEKD